MADPFVVDTVITQIAAASALSPQANIGQKTLVGIFIPANWTTASLSFQASPDGGVTFAELDDATATAIAIASVTGGAALYVTLDPTKWRGIQCIKVRSGTAAAPVNQTNTVNLSLLTRFVF